jgi:hypothetical protein
MICRSLALRNRAEWIKSASTLGAPWGVLILASDGNFARIVNAIQAGRAAFENIRKSPMCIRAHDVPEVVPYVAFAAI